MNYINFCKNHLFFFSIILGFFDSNTYLFYTELDYFSKKHIANVREVTENTLGTLIAIFFGGFNQIYSQFFIFSIVFTNMCEHGCFINVFLCIFNFWKCRLKLEVRRIYTIPIYVGLISNSGKFNIATTYLLNSIIPVAKNSLR